MGTAEDFSFRRGAQCAPISLDLRAIHLVRTAAQASSVRLSGENPVYQHRLYGIQKAPIPTGTGAFLYKRCKEYVLFGLHIQHADRIEHAQHSHAGIGEYGQPHGCDTEQTRQSRPQMWCS